MVHSARDGWPRLTARGEELFRAAVRVVLDPSTSMWSELHEAALSGERMRLIAADPVLAEGARQTTTENLLHWASANVEHPGRRVAPVLGPAALRNARDLARRGLDRDSLDSFRTAQAAAWRLWLEICFNLTENPGELRELLEASSVSISTFIEDCITAMSKQMDAEREDLALGANAERRAVLTLLLEGAPIDRTRAERQLNYRFRAKHTAVIIWGAPDVASSSLESVAESVVRACDATRRLTIVASAGTLWLWIPGPLKHHDQLTKEASAHPQLQIAIGRTASGLEGFRRSHLDAIATQRTLAALTSQRQVATFSDIALVDLLGQDTAGAAEFVADTLGSLASAERELREIVLTYIREQCNASRTASKLFTHRNTILRRLAQAESLLPQPLEDNVVHIGAALELVSWRSDDS